MNSWLSTLSFYELLVFVQLSVVNFCIFIQPKICTLVTQFSVLQLAVHWTFSLRYSSTTCLYSHHNQFSLGCFYYIVVLVVQFYFYCLIRLQFNQFNIFSLFKSTYFCIHSTMVNFTFLCAYSRFLNLCLFMCFFRKTNIVWFARNSIVSVIPLSVFKYVFVRKCLCSKPRRHRYHTQW